MRLQYDGAMLFRTTVIKVFIEMTEGNQDTTTAKWLKSKRMIWADNITGPSWDFYVKSYQRWYITQKRPVKLFLMPSPFSLWTIITLHRKVFITYFICNTVPILCYFDVHNRLLRRLCISETIYLPKYTAANMNENKNFTYIIMYIYCKESTSVTPITVTNIFCNNTRLPRNLQLLWIFCRYK